jgi:hypothetical protein
VNKCFSHSCTLGGATYHEEKHPGTHHIKCHFCSMRLSCVVSQYLLGSLGDSQKITRHGKKKNDKDETGNVLLNLICSYPSIT